MIKHAELFPKISAQIYNSPNSTEEFFLFNATTNKGFAVDGFAALLCKKFTGENKLSDIIASFESEQNLSKGEFESEISELLGDLEQNRLLTFYSEAQAPEKNS